MTPDQRVLFTLIVVVVTVVGLLGLLVAAVRWDLRRLGEDDEDTDADVPTPTTRAAGAEDGRHGLVARMSPVCARDPRDPIVDADPEDPFSATELADVLTPERSHRDAALFADQVSTTERLAALGPQRKVNPWLAL